MIMPNILVKDVDTSVAFYNKLGFKTQMVMPDASGKNAFAIVEMGDNMIGVGSDEKLSTDGVGKGVEFMIYLPDETKIDDHYASTLAAGLAAEDLGTAYWGDRTYNVLDPDGYRIMIAQTVEQVNIDRVAAVFRGEEAPTKTN